MSRRQTGAALALLAIVLMLVASFTKAWWVAEEHGISVRSGFLGYEFCERDGECESGSWSDERRGGLIKLVSYAGYGALTGTLIVVGLLGFAAFRAMSPSSPPPRSVGLVAAVLSAVGLAGAISYAFSWVVVDLREDFSVGWAAYLYFAGAITGIAAAILCRGQGQAAAPAAAAPGAVPAPESGVPACRQCGAPTTWDGRHARYYCRQCAVFV